jgi:biotin carboxyl carrier protein
MPLRRFPQPVDPVAAGSLVAPMPGTVRRVDAVVGQRVEAGRPLVWLEAMKMEHLLTAPAAGVVADVAVAAGAQVEVGTVLVVVTGDEAPDPGAQPGAQPGDAANGKEQP